MSRASARKGSWGRRGRAAWLILAAAVVGGLPSAARGMEDEDAGDAGKVKIQGVVVRPNDPLNPSRRPVTVILGETKKGRRKLVTALPVDAGSKASELTARGGTHEVHMSLTSQTERYDEWIFAERMKEFVTTSGGTIVLDQALSALEISCPREVTAGAAINVELTGVGDAIDTWDTWLVYPAAGDNPGDGPTPDGSRYEQQTLETGAEAGGKSRLTATFKTYPADTGKLLGVCITRSESDEKAVIWVRVK